MSGVQNGVLSTQDLSDLFRSYIAAFGPIAEAPDALDEEIARVIPGEGESFRIPLSPSSNHPEVMDGADPQRDYEGMEEYYCEGKHRLIAPKSTRRLYDSVMSSRLQFQLFSDNVMEMLISAPAIWRNLLAKTMDQARRGVLKSYNGQNFFSLTHPVNPLKPEYKNQANLVQAPLMDKKVAVAAVKLLDNMRGHNNLRINRNSRRLLLVVPNEDLYVRASEIWTADMIAQAIGANAAAVIKNQLARLGVSIVKFPELDDYSSKASYLLDVTSGTERAFLISKVRQVTPYYTGLSPEDEVRRKSFSVEAGYDAYGGAAVGLHQKAVCIEETT